MFLRKHRHNGECTGMRAVEFEQVLSLDDIKNAFWESFRSSGLYLLWVILLIATAVVVLLCGIVWDNEPFGILAICIGVAIYRTPATYVKRGLKHRNEIADRTSHFTIDEQGITIRGADILVSGKWSAFTLIKETPKYLYIFLKNTNKCFFIHKARISQSTLDNLISILADAPVEKRLLSLPAHAST